MSQAEGHTRSAGALPCRAYYRSWLTTTRIATMWLATLAVAASAQAQNPDQLGGQARADATSELVVLAVPSAHCRRRPGSR